MEDVDPTTKKRKLSSHDLCEKAIATSKDTSLGAQIHETESENSSEFKTSETKRVKSQAALDLSTRFREAGKKKRDEEQQRLQASVDHAIMRLIYVRGMDPTIVDSDEWKEFVTLLNPSYHPTSSSTFAKMVTMCTDDDIVNSPYLPVAGTTQPNATSTRVEPDWDW